MLPFGRLLRARRRLLILYCLGPWTGAPL